MKEPMLLVYGWTNAHRKVLNIINQFKNHEKVSLSNHFIRRIQGSL